MSPVVSGGRGRVARGAGVAELGDAYVVCPVEVDQAWDTAFAAVLHGVAEGRVRDFGRDVDLGWVRRAKLRNGPRHTTGQITWSALPPLQQGHSTPFWLKDLVEVGFALTSKSWLIFDSLHAWLLPPSPRPMRSNSFAGSYTLQPALPLPFHPLPPL